MAEGVALGGLPRRGRAIVSAAGVGFRDVSWATGCFVPGSSVSVRGLTSLSGRLGLGGRGCPGRRGVLFHGVEDPALRMDWALIVD